MFDNSFPPSAPPLRGIFEPNSGYIARYASFIWLKSPANCDVHLSESNFQIRSKQTGEVQIIPVPKITGIPNIAIAFTTIPLDMAMISDCFVLFVE